MVVRKKRHPGKILLFNASKMFSKGRPRNHLETGPVEQIAAVLRGVEVAGSAGGNHRSGAGGQGRLQSLAEPVCVHGPLIGLGALCVRLMSLLLRFTRSSRLVVNSVIRRDWATLLLAISGFSLIAPTVSAGWNRDCRPAAVALVPTIAPGSRTPAGSGTGIKLQAARCLHSRPGRPFQPRGAGRRAEHLTTNLCGYR